MQLPLVAPAPLVSTHAVACRDLFENRCQFAHFEHDLTGLMVLENKSMANIARCLLESADKTNRARFFSEAAWDPAQVNDRRIRYLLDQTRAQRQPKHVSALVLDDTLGAHVGSLCAHVDRHYNQGEGTYPLAHNPVTSFYVSGAVRFPLDLRLYRRDEEVTQWETFVARHYPGRPIPHTTKERARLHKEVDPVLLQDPEFLALHAQFVTKIDRGIELIEAAMRHKTPFGVLLFDGWYLSEELVRVAARRHKAWISILKRTRTLETASFVLKDATGTASALPGPHLAVKDLGPLIPATAYRAVTVGAHTYWRFTLVVRIPGLGKVRLVISFQHADLSGSYVVRCWSPTSARGVPSGSSPRICCAGPPQPFTRTARDTWAWTRTACGAPKPLQSIGVWSSWPIRSCTSPASRRHWLKERPPSEPSGRCVASKPSRCSKSCCFIRMTVSAVELPSRTW